MDKDIEKRVKTCESCQNHQSMSASAPVHLSERTNNPWVRLHIDYLGPFMGKIFLVVVDSYSEWVEVLPVSNLTSETTINCLRTCFATHGLPQICVSDNGSCFTTDEFERFMKKNSILHIKSAPYHPVRNGCVERLVRTFKNTFRKVEVSGSLNEKLNTFLFAYRITPQSTTGISPTKLLMNRKLNSKLNIIKPSVK